MGARRNDRQGMVVDQGDAFRERHSTSENCRGNSRLSRRWEESQFPAMQWSEWISQNPRIDVHLSKP
jgi:hypothetical protein